jgi:hypothetical protein
MNSNLPGAVGDAPLDPQAIKMPIALAVGRELGKRRDARFKAWVQRHRNPPDLLFHYTTSQGLLGIVQTNNLWATNISYMNDTSELTLACRMTREILDERVSSEDSEEVRVEPPHD